MGLTNFVSTVGFCKIGTVVLGFIVLCLGCFSHFLSDWVKSSPCEGDVCLYWYDACKYGFPFTCPDICLERIFVAIIILCFVGSLAILVTTYFFDDTKTDLFKFISSGYYGQSALLLIIGAILYLVSAEQINKTGLAQVYGLNVRQSEKLTAGYLGVFQAILHGVTTFFILKGNS